MKKFLKGTLTCFMYVILTLTMLVIFIDLDIPLIVWVVGIGLFVTRKHWKKKLNRFKKGEVVIRK